MLSGSQASGKELALWHLFSLYVEGPLWLPSVAPYRLCEVGLPALQHLPAGSGPPES